MKKRFIIFLILSFAIYLITVELLPGIFQASHNTIDLLVRAPVILLGRHQSAQANTDAKKANIIVMMDDGWTSEYKVGYKLMKDKGLQGTIAVVTNLAGTAEFMNCAQLWDIYSNGWDLVNHTSDHGNLIGLKRDEQEEQINDGIKWLRKHGFKRGMDILAYPYGHYNDITIDLIKELGLRSARTISFGFNEKGEFDINKVQSFVVLSHDSVEEVEGIINEAVRHDSTLILVFHKFGSGDEYSYDPGSFSTLIEYLDSIRDDVNIITYSQWLDSLDCAEQNLQLPAS